MKNKILNFLLIFVLFTTVLVFLYNYKFKNLWFTKNKKQSLTFQKKNIKTLEMTWQNFAQYNPKTKKLPEEAEKIIANNLVKIPGFIVALETNLRQSKNFLLVPNREYCIHVPPPPPHLMIFVESNVPVNIEESWNPVWIEGKLLREEQKTSTYGDVMWKLKAHKVYEYKWDDEES